MKEDRAAAALPHPWSSVAFLIKAQRNVAEMLATPRDDWKFAFWSTLILELLGRAALASFSPTLLAEHNDWAHLYYALGHVPKAKKYVPKSIITSQVFERLGEIVVDFTPEIKGFCLAHSNRRNADLHSGESSFEGIKASSWLPGFYLSNPLIFENVNEIS